MRSGPAGRCGTSSPPALRTRPSRVRLRVHPRRDPAPVGLRALPARGQETTPMVRSHSRSALVLSLAAGTLAVGGCRQGALPTPHVQATATPLPSSPPEPPGPPDAGVASAVAQVLGAARHPELKWADVRDVAPT